MPLGAGPGSCSRDQFSSVAQSCPSLCEPMDCSMPGFPVYHQLPEIVQTQGIHTMYQRIHGSRDTHNLVFELFCQYRNPYQVGEVNCVLPTSTKAQTGWNWKDDDVDSHLPHHQPIRRIHRLITPSLDYYCHTPHYRHHPPHPCPVWDTQF